MADTTVKFFHSAMSGAPVLSGTAGALLAVLDACFADGFGLSTLDSLVISGGVATATRSAGLPQEVGSVALISGATPSGLNGEKKVISATATTFTFDAAGIADQTATGTITQKFAPAGWSKAFTGTNKRAYKPSDPTATQCLLRVDDSGAQVSRVVGYESMSDVDTGMGPFPTAAQRSGGSYWTKSSAANSTARNWIVCADSRFLYFAREYAASNVGAYELHVFGDFSPTKSGDAYACILSGEASNQASLSISSTDNFWYGNTISAAEIYTPRSYTGIGSSTQMRKSMPAIFGATAYYSGNGALPYPNPGDGGLYVVPHYLSDHAVPNLRGLSPGFYAVPQAVPNGQFAARDTVTGVTGLSGKTLRALTCSSNPLGLALLDTTGPWR